MSETKYEPQWVDRSCKEYYEGPQDSLGIYETLAKIYQTGIGKETKNNRPQAVVFFIASHA
jgi:hypothetical protein